MKNKSKVKKMALVWSVESCDNESIPTDLFAILELQNPLHDVPELHEIRWSPDPGVI